MIIFDEHAVRIMDKLGNEIVMWDIQEWIDDPEVVFSICNAVKLSASGKENKLKQILAFDFRKNKIHKEK